MKNKLFSLFLSCCFLIVSPFVYSADFLMDSGYEAVIENVKTTSPSHIFTVPDKYVSAPGVLIVPMQISLSKNSNCLLYTSPSPRDLSTSRMPSSA